nr:hypothetical protein [Wenjunlia vitaminophila]
MARIPRALVEVGADGRALLHPIAGTRRVGPPVRDGRLATELLLPPQGTPST